MADTVDSGVIALLRKIAVSHWAMQNHDQEYRSPRQAFSYSSDIIKVLHRTAYDSDVYPGVISAVLCERLRDKNFFFYPLIQFCL